MSDEQQKPEEKPAREANPTSHPEPNRPVPPPPPRRKNEARGDGWLTLDEAAAYTGHHRETVRRAAVDYQRDNRRGLRSAQRNAHACWRFQREDLDRWVMGQPPARVRAA